MDSMNRIKRQSYCRLSKKMASYLFRNDDPPPPPSFISGNCEKKISFQTWTFWSRYMTKKLFFSTNWTQKLGTKMINKRVAWINLGAIWAAAENFSWEDKQAKLTLMMMMPQHFSFRHGLTLSFRDFFKERRLLHSTPLDSLLKKQDRNSAWIKKNRMDELTNSFLGKSKLIWCNAF